METVFIVWSFSCDSDFTAKISGYSKYNSNKELLRRVFVAKIIKMISLAVMNNGRFNTPKKYPDMRERTIYFEVSFKKEADMVNFLKSARKVI